ncbi:MAG: hypothetical protein K0R68_953 [Mycobacterium sp.]|nr:hypothetical protein [Mycobacterium sp.]
MAHRPTATAWAANRTWVTGQSSGRPSSVNNAAAGSKTLETSPSLRHGPDRGSTWRPTSSARCARQPQPPLGQSHRHRLPQDKDSASLSMPSPNATSRPDLTEMAGQASGRTTPAAARPARAA